MRTINACRGKGHDSDKTSYMWSTTSQPLGGPPCVPPTYSWGRPVGAWDNGGPLGCAPLKAHLWAPFGPGWETFFGTAARKGSVTKRVTVEDAIDRTVEKPNVNYNVNRGQILYRV